LLNGKFLFNYVKKFDFFDIYDIIGVLKEEIK